MDTVYRVQIQDLIDWLEEKLNAKYEINLQGLKSRLYKFYNIIFGTLEYVVELSNLFSDGKLENSNSYAKPLVDNCMNILKLIVQEYPSCLDLEFIEGFLSTITEKISIFNANFHPILHFDSNDKSLAKKVAKLAKKINQTFDIVIECYNDIASRAKLSVPLLKAVEDALKQFRDPTKRLIEEVKALKANKINIEYQMAFNEFLGHLQRDTQNKKGAKVKKMINLTKDTCINQLQLETILDTPSKLSQIFKAKGKKNLSEDIKSDVQAKVIQFVNLLTKPDFISVHLNNIQPNDLITSIKALESQKYLIEELKKQGPNLNTGIDEILFLNEEEFKEIFDKWKQCNQEMATLLQDADYQKELMDYKTSLPISLLDLRKFSEKLWEYQHSIVQYNKLCNLISKLKYQVQKFCLKEFHERVEVVYEDF